MPSSEIPAEFNPRFIEKLDQRTTAARILRQRLADLESDLGGDLSYQKSSLARRVIWLESFIETMEAKAAEGQEVDMGKQVAAINSLVGLFRLLGLERKAREVPDLQTYLAAKAEEKAHEQ